MRRLLAVFTLVVVGGALAIGPGLAVASGITMSEAKRVVRAAGKRLTIEFNGSGYSVACARKSANDIRCRLYLYDTTVGDCSILYRTYADSVGIHAREVGGDDCPP